MSIFLAEGVGGSNQYCQKVSVVPKDIRNRWYDHPTHIFEIIDMSRNVNKLATTLENGIKLTDSKKFDIHFSTVVVLKRFSGSGAQYCSCLWGLGIFFTVCL